MKNARSLKTIAAEIHELERASVFDASAENYMNAARVAKKFVTVTNLKVPLRIIYDLDPDDPDLPDDIEVLSQASKHRQLTVSEAVDVLEFGAYAPRARGPPARDLARHGRPVPRQTVV